MAYLSETIVRERAALITKSFQKSAGAILADGRISLSENFDIFLSHSSSEPDEILLGVKKTLEDTGLTVYVDKYSDPQLSPERVTPETAEILRSRMRRSNSLLYVHSQHSKRSRWMPWELGYFDGLKGNVGILPVTIDQESTFRGEEYLNLYPYVDVAKAQDGKEQLLWLTKSSKEYARLYGWAKGSEKIRMH